MPDISTDLIAIQNESESHEYTLDGFDVELESWEHKLARQEAEVESIAIRLQRLEDGIKELRIPESKMALSRIAACLEGYFFHDFNSKLWRRKGSFALLVKALKSETETFTYGVKREREGTFTEDDRACFESAFSKSRLPCDDNLAFISTLAEEIGKIKLIGVTHYGPADVAETEKLAMEEGGSNPIIQMMMDACGHLADSYPKYEDPRTIV